MAVHGTREDAYKRATSILGKIGLPQVWCDFGQRDTSSADGTVNDCCYAATWIVRDNGGRERSDYRNGSIKALRADRAGDNQGTAGPQYDELPASTRPRMGDLILLRWSSSGLPDHIGFVTSVNSDGSVNTIEANTGPSVGVYVPCGGHRRTRFAANIVGYLRPHYES